MISYCSSLVEVVSFCDLTTPNVEITLQPPLRPGILIVEDDEELRSLIARVFERETYDVFLAGDGSEAIQIFKDHRDVIQVLLTDLGLPGIGGHEVIATVKGLKPKTAIIGVSGFGGGAVRAMALAAGADLFLEKPFDVRALVKTIHILLNGE